MTYEVRLSRRAASYLRRLDRQSENRILDRLDEISHDPFGRHTKSLTNAEGQRSSRVGDWRIIFIVNEDEHVIEVT